MGVDEGERERERESEQQGQSSLQWLLFWLAILGKKQQLYPCSLFSVLLALCSTVLLALHHSL